MFFESRYISSSYHVVNSILAYISMSYATPRRRDYGPQGCPQGGAQAGGPGCPPLGGQGVRLGVGMGDQGVRIGGSWLVGRGRVGAACRAGRCGRAGRGRGSRAAQLGAARLGSECREERRGQGRPGVAWLGMVWFGLSTGKAGPGKARSVDREGVGGKGLARIVEWEGEGRAGAVRRAGRRGGAGRCGRVRRGRGRRAAGLGGESRAAWLGLARFGPSSGLAWSGGAWVVSKGVAGPGRCGKARRGPSSGKGGVGQARGDLSPGLARGGASGQSPSSVSRHLRPQIPLAPGSCRHQAPSAARTRGSLITRPLIPRRRADAANETLSRRLGIPRSA